MSKASARLKRGMAQDARRIDRIKVAIAKRRLAKKGAKKEENDNYPTPASLALALAEETYEVIGLDRKGKMPEHLIEPSCGTGAFVRAMKTVWSDYSYISAIDINPSVEQSVTNAGAANFWASDWPEWAKTNSPPHPAIVLGNPPFSLAQRHIEAGFDHLQKGSYISFLLRLSFWGGLERTKSFWDFRGLPYLYSFTPIAPRPSFVRGTSDNSEYGLFVWKVKSAQSTIVRPSIVWKKS